MISEKKSDEKNIICKQFFYFHQETVFLLFNYFSIFLKEYAVVHGIIYVCMYMSTQVLQNVFER